MKLSIPKNALLFLTAPMILLLAVAAAYGIYDPRTYAAETMYWATQGIGQDVVTLFIIVPLLIMVTIFAARGGQRAYLLWAGLQFYVAYSYVLYAFSCHFNHLFLVYCGILGLSVWALLRFFYSAAATVNQTGMPQRIPAKSSAFFLLIVSTLFYLLWLSEIIPALVRKEIPASIVDTGLLVNPVHVLDLSICLPALIVTAILLLRRHPLGAIFTPAMLVFCILMALAILGMVIAMVMKGLEADPVVSLIVLLLAIISFIFLWRFMIRLKTAEP